ncbi:MAG: tellurite resistance/C4-dicarboxylate transporter family protein [Symbiobacteriia bacterium]
MVKTLHPGYLAMVMATGIISTAFLMLNQMLLSGALLGVAGLAYVVLVALYTWRILRYPDEVSADVHEPQRAFGFFTFVAASNVLAIRVALSGNLRLSEFLWLLGSLGWLVLTYVIPSVLIMQPEKKPIGEALNGSWLIWVVGTQSVAAAAATLAFYHAGRTEALATVAVFMWSVGVVLYLALIGMIMMRLFFHKLEPVYLSPPYWINMGACAITVIAGARILVLPPELAAIQVVRPVVEGLSFMLWAWGTWWIPSLVIMGVWRHGYQHHPLSYEPTLWSMVFPLGMYAASSTAFGRAVELPLLVGIAHWEVWIALVAWVLVLAGLVSTWLRPRRQTAAP